MKVLVTGANGFIGGHVSSALKKAGHYVIGMDVSAGRQSYVDEWMYRDITQPLDKIEGLDAVIHLAAIAAPKECDANPGHAFDVNVNGTMQVLRMALASGAKKFVFSSSAHVYDIPPKYMPTDESHPLRLNNTYTTTKILGEALCQLFHDNHGLSTTVLRLYNAYGVDQAKGYFIPDQLAKAEKGNFDLYGANVTKDWVWVDDVANAFVKAVETKYVGALNIGTGVETSLGVIGGLIASHYKVAMNIHTEARPTRMQADISRAKDVLGWAPTKTIEGGLSAIFASKTAIRA